MVDHNPDWVRFVDKSKCENVVTRREDCTYLGCDRQERCRLDRGSTHCFAASSQSRAMLDPYWIGGTARYAKRTSIKYVFLLQNDPLAGDFEKVSAEDAIKYLEEGRVELPLGPGPLLSTQRNQPFFNPHLLVTSSDRHELHKRQFARLFNAAEVYLVNTGRASKAEISRRLLGIVGAGLGQLL